MLRSMKKQSHELLEQRRPALIKGLQDFSDFYLELKWDFHSWCTCTSYCLIF